MDGLTFDTSSIFKDGVKTDDCYYNLEVKQLRAYDTDYYVVTVPYQIDGEIVEPYSDYKISGSHPTPLEYAQQNFTTVTINGSAALQNTSGTFLWGKGNYFSKGVCIHEGDVPTTETLATNSAKYVSINQDRTMSTFDIYSTKEQLQQSGAYTTAIAYYMLIENGQKCDLSNVTINEGATLQERFPFMVIGVTANKDLKFIACDGRTSANYGMLATEMQEICLQENLITAASLDGGGSTSLTYKGSKLNRNIDERGTSDRSISCKLNIKKENAIANKYFTEAVSQIGIEKQRTIQQIMPMIWDCSFVINTQDSILELARELPVNGVALRRFSGDTPVDLPGNGYVPSYNFIHNANSSVGKTSCVISTTYSGSELAINTYENNKWYGWNIYRPDTITRISSPQFLTNILNAQTGNYTYYCVTSDTSWLPDADFKYCIIEAKVIEASNPEDSIVKLEATQYNGARKAIKMHQNKKWYNWRIYNPDPI